MLISNLQHLSACGQDFLINVTRPVMTRQRIKLASQAAKESTH